ncbi:MAG: DNA gyrase subunit A [Patescibacteria group bacterium]
MKVEKKEEKKERIKIRPLEKEMEESYLDYAMSVIVSRALPDVRDGLKPVQRRILYSMWQMGLRAGANFRKSAAIIGQILGKYHPHGDLAVYDALVRMAQDFSLRYPLIDGQGNFGSIDGDPPAAYRYTEARLSPLAEELLFDLEKETVDWIPNYDGTTKEPVVLPAKLPNLLINGASGIAVGVATNIFPHNLTEVCDAIIYLIDHPEAQTKDLMKFILGPDFPTGGLAFIGENFSDEYNFGKGKIIIRAKTEILRQEGRTKIIITEIPYLIEKSALLKRISEVISEKKIQEVKDIYDLSNKEGINIVIELKKEANPEKVLNHLFILTPLQVSFHFNFLALVDGLQVKNLSLKDILENYLSYRKKVVRKRTEWELKKVMTRIHLLEGFELALKNLNQVIKIIKEAKDKEKAKNNLKKEFNFSDQQASAILDLRLWQLNRLEREKIKGELKDLKEKKEVLSSILADPSKILEVIKNEIKEIKEKYGDERRTKIIRGMPKEFKEEELIPDESTIVILTNDGYIKRISPEQFKVQERGGKGTIISKAKESDIISHLLFTSTLSELLFFTNKGKVFKLKTYEISQKGKTAKGEALVNFFSLSSDEKISSLLAKLPQDYFYSNIFKEKETTKFLILATKNGLIKRVEKENFEKIRKDGLMAIGLEKDDQLTSVKPSTGNDEVFLITRYGLSIRFSEKELRKLSRSAKGIRGIKLSPSDEVVALEVIPKKTSPQAKIFTITENGLGKFSLLSSYRKQKRGGSGIKTHRLNEKTGKLVTGLFIDEKSFSERIKGDLMIATFNGQILRIPLQNIPLLGRVSQGVKLIKFKDKNDKIASVTLI